MVLALLIERQKPNSSLWESSIRTVIIGKITDASDANHIGIGEFVQIVVTWTLSPLCLKRVLKFDGACRTHVGPAGAVELGKTI